MESLKGREDAVQILLIETDAVVLDKYCVLLVKSSFRVLLCQPVNFHHGFFFAMKFEGIAYEVLKELDHLELVSIDGREFPDFNPPAGLS